MVPSSAPRFIVRQRPGPGTADTIYTDNHGDEWIQRPCGPFILGGTTGTIIGWINTNGTIDTERR